MSENKLVKLIEEKGITSKAVMVDNNSDWKDADAWKVTLKKDKRQMTVPFYMGYGHKGAEPKAKDILGCMLLDASTVENGFSFEDFCGEFGYDTDSRKHLKTYNNIVKGTEKLKRFLGEDFQEMYENNDY